MFDRNADGTEDPGRVLPLDYASGATRRPDLTGQLILGLLIAFLALAGAFLGIVIYMSRIG